MDDRYQSELKSVAANLAKDLKKTFPDITGISLSGSLAAGNADEFSDIDLDIWISEETYQKWMTHCPLMDYLISYSPNRETPSNISFLIDKSYKFDLAILSIDRVKTEEWKVEQKSDRKYSEIIFDSDNLVKDLLNQKTKSKPDSFDAKEKYSVLNPNPDYYVFYISAYLNYHVPIAIVRNRFEQAHFLLNQSIHFLLNLLWLNNENFYPYDKSKWTIAEKVLNEEQKQLLSDAQLVKEYTAEDIRRRRQLLRDLYAKLGFKEITFYHEKVDLR
ncbi:MAG TPA: nucleotidyltransferase domain-containing protein [Candidatus Nanoarchaeia archaeon]|nr:nucleotidyltransferase domain-containing protein [Candidatus Nanoarchaeia archaeon]